MEIRGDMIQEIGDTGKMLVMTPVPGLGVLLMANGKLMGILSKAEVDDLIAKLRTADTWAWAKHQ